MAHTPGPWTIRRVGIAKDLPVITSAEHDICEMRYNTNGRLRLESNARLIAAAPELLAALRLALPILRQAHDRGFAIKEVEPVYNQAEAAIKQAEAE